MHGSEIVVCSSRARLRTRQRHQLLSVEGEDERADFPPLSCAKGSWMIRSNSECQRQVIIIPRRTSYLSQLEGPFLTARFVAIDIAT
jgi:hypothetical protein